MLREHRKNSSKGQPCSGPLTTSSQGLSRAKREPEKRITERPGQKGGFGGGRGGEKVCGVEEIRQTATTSHRVHPTKEETALGFESGNATNQKGQGNLVGH